MANANKKNKLNNQPIYNNPFKIMNKARKLYWTFTTTLGLFCVVTKIRGEGILKSYGQHHNTDLDDLLQNDKFETTHPDSYLQIENKLPNVYDSTCFTNKNDCFKALYIISKYYNCSERIELNTDDFFNLLN